MTRFLLISAFLCSTTVFDGAFERGAEAYRDGDYAAAAAQFEQLVLEGIENADVFYNLGNAYYRSGRLGAAIANYERALQIDPNHQGAQHNLDHCLRHTERRLERPLPPDWEQSLLFWHYGLARRTTYILGSVCWLALWLVLSLRQLLRRGNTRGPRYLRRTAAVLALLSLAFGMSAIVKANPPDYAVASSPNVPVRYGTDDSETERFQLFEGDRVVVDRRANGWSRVRTATGEWGWTRDEGLTFVGPPYLPPPESPDDESPSGERSAE